MRLQAILKTNFKALKVIILVMVGVIVLAEWFPKVVNVMLGNTWSDKFQLNHSLTLNTLSVMFLFSMVIVVTSNLPIFNQFNIPRKDQFKGNLLTILLSSLLLLVVFYVVYPLVLQLFFNQIEPIKSITFVGNSILNSSLNWLSKLIELISAGLGGYFVAVFIKRFSMKWFVFLAILGILVLPIVLIIVMALLPKSMSDAVTNLFNQLSENPFYHLSVSLFELLFTSSLIKLMTRRLTVKK